MQIDQRNSPKLMWIIAAGLVVVILLVAVFFWFNNSKNDAPAHDQLNNSVATQKTEANAPAIAQAVEQTTSSEPSQIENHVELVNESILKDKVPDNASLAKEEVAKLDDIQKQLNDQQKSLESQHTDADQLIKLKEEQIKLLEQQLAAQSK